MTLELTALYVHGAAQHIGYSRMGVQLAKHLELAGVDVYDRFEGPNTPEHFHDDDGRRAKRTNSVLWMSVPAHCRGWYDGQVASILTMFETTKLPETYRENLEEFETILVPSEQNAELFGKYHPNVKVVPLGVDPADWHYRERSTPGPYFDFLIGGSGGRKGVDLAHKAFLAVFGTEGSWGDGPIPRLIMKAPKASADYVGNARIIQINGFIPLEDEIELYARCHAYVQPSRGEGFGLQPLQALAQGMPTILTGAHGHAAFSHLGYELGSKLVKAGYFIAGDAGDWWEPDFDDLCSYMDYVYRDYETARLKAADSARTVAECFTWNDSARKLIDALGRDSLSVPYVGPGSWHEPYLKRYPVITNKDMSCDIAGIAYRFVKGELMYCVADVKRLLWEGGHLDPECLDTTRWDDIGLNESQMANLAAYNERFQYCQHCFQKLGSGILRSDVLYEALAD